MDAPLRSLLIVAELSATWGLLAWFLFARRPWLPVARIVRLFTARRD